MTLHVAVIGIDGSGKSSLVAALQAALEARGRTVRRMEWFRQPEFRALAGCFNEAEEMTPEVLAALHAGCTLALLAGLQPGKVDVCLWDRFAYDSYASCTIRGASPTLMRRLVAQAPRPDLVVRLVGDPRTCFRRITQQRKNLVFYETGLDRLFRRRCTQAQARFTSGRFPAHLVEEVFVETMSEWNERLGEITEGDKVVTLPDFDLKDLDHQCERLVRAIEALSTEISRQV